MTIENTFGVPITGNKSESMHPEMKTEKPVITKEGHPESESTGERSNISHYKVTKSELEEGIRNINDFLSPTRRNLKFELHDKLDKYFVSVVDSLTNEIIKEIPPKKFLDMYAAMAEYMGILVDEKI